MINFLIGKAVAKPQVLNRSKLVGRSRRVSLLLSAGLLSLGAQLGLAADRPFSDCVQDLQAKARQQNIASWVVDKELSQVEYLPKVIELDRRQPEFTATFYSYYQRRVSDTRINKGKQLLVQHADLLRRLTRDYGVPAPYLLAFWGLETNFGSYLGNMNVLNSLATLACDPRRSKFFTSELMAALKILETRVVTREQMVGSWAGAMGNMQFMPSNYRRFALDADQDGRADLWGSVPDALTSAAYFLQKLGWESELRWGREVLLPQGFDYAKARRDFKQPLSYWVAQGVTDIHGNRLPALDIPAAVIVPAGAAGPAFLAYKNFNVIMRWNHSEFYALAVGRLADRIRGMPELFQPPAVAEPMRIDQVKQMQQQLQSLGFDPGKPDGIMGSKTREAIRDFQQSEQLIADAYPGPELMALVQRRFNATLEEAQQ